LGFKLLPELISAILSIYVTLTTPTNQQTFDQASQEMPTWRS